LGSIPDTNYSKYRLVKKPLWKTVSRLVKKIEICLRHNPEIPLLGTYSREMKAAPCKDA
jgi:hypothetical protein